MAALHSPPVTLADCDEQIRRVEACQHEMRGNATIECTCAELLAQLYGIRAELLRRQIPEQPPSRAAVFDPTKAAIPARKDNQ